MGSHKKGERPPGPPSPEMMCTVKCTMEKKGVLSGGKILVEEARKDPKLLKYVSADKVDAVMDCLKGLEVKECSDMQKVFACSKDVMQWTLLTFFFVNLEFWNLLNKTIGRI